MRKTLLILTLLMGTIGVAQSVTTSSNTDTLNCNGYAELIDTASFSNWYWTDSNDDTLLINGSYLQDLCEGTYFLFTTDTLSVDSTITFSIENDLSANCNGLEVNLSNIYPFSIDGDCAGYLEATVTGGTQPYSYSWSNQATTALNDGLCAGSYTVTVLDANACSATISGMVYDSTSTQTPIDSLSINVSTINVSEEGACDGAVNIQIYGGTQPYNVIQSSGDSVANINDLCAGFYDVTITDANGASISYSYLISTPAATFDNDTYTDSTVVDTVSAILQEECDINYQNIDSVYISTVNVIAQDSIEVSWVVFYNGTQSSVITQFYNTEFENGTYTLELSLYCPNKATDNFLKATDQIYFSDALIGSTGVNGISEYNNIEMSVYPNPVNDVVTIKLDNNASFNVEVFDMTGKLLLSENNKNNSVSLNVSELSNGQYIIKVSQNNAIITRKIIK